MATFGGSTVLTLADIKARMGKDDKIARIAEVLKEMNEINEDIMFVEANDGTSHRTTIRSGFPEVAWRVFNQGTQPSSSTTVQVKDACGMLEGYSQVDKALADLNGNSAEVRLSEDTAFMETFSQQVASTLIYGNTESNPEQFMGLSPRYSSLSAENADNIIDAEGTGSDNTSVWFVVWSPNIIHGIYPKGSKVGLSFQDLGEQTLTDDAGGMYQGYRTHFKWDLGLTLRDWRGVARICNIDVSELSDAGETGYDGANLPNLFIKAYNKVRRLVKRGRPVIYCNETIMTALDLIASNKTNTWFTKTDGVDGNAIVRFRGIPIKLCDAILDTEEAVA